MATKKLLGVEFCEEGSSLEIQTSYIHEVCERFHEHKIPISSLDISKGSKVGCPCHDKNLTYRIAIS